MYQYPLAVIAGLSETGQLAAVRHNAQIYLWRAAIGSALVVLFTAVLGRMSWQLTSSRAREGATKLKHAKRVEYLVHHDGLTALPNRSLFNKLLSQAISQSQRYHRQLAVAFIDLDRFKQINDTMGHEAGDEFVVLLAELVEEKYAAMVAQKIISTIANPFILLGQEFRVTASLASAPIRPTGWTNRR